MAVPVQQTLPPYDVTGFIGSYVNESGASAAGGVDVSTPSPSIVLALPPLERLERLGPGAAAATSPTSAIC